LRIKGVKSTMLDSLASNAHSSGDKQPTRQMLPANRHRESKRRHTPRSRNIRCSNAARLPPLPCNSNRSKTEASEFWRLRFGGYTEWPVGTQWEALFVVLWTVDTPKQQSVNCTKRRS